MTADATWYEQVADLPEMPIWAEHITLTPHWAAAWEKVTTEQVRDFRHLLLSDGDDAELVSYYLVDHSPFWTENEQVVGVDPVWPGPVVYAPSTYAEYGGAGAKRTDFIAEAVDRGLELTREWGAVALVFSNLTPDVLSRWSAIRPTSMSVLFDVAYFAPIGQSIEDFLAMRPGSNVRREFRRQWRRGMDAGLKVRRLFGTEMVPVLDEFAALTVDTSAAHGYNMYGADLFHAVAEVPGAIMLAAEHDGTLAGGFLCLRHGNRLSAWTAGIDYPRLRNLHTYGTLAYEAVSYAVDSGAAIIDMGRSNHLYKQRLGLTGVDLYAGVYLAEDDYNIQASLTELHIRLIARNHAGRRP
ncbi:GNAT family N-acetyltransferase [Sphaerisporangium aureirubrum]|uniref:GNAT family N-acetyltransferase n=1 Tax=Sphaerisporangium aureirubrum TaxID=1544736 RepID=A0ABW1NLX8_9ACTN